MKTILLIDHSNYAEIIREFLELADYKVHHANNGKSGIVLAIEKHPDIVICDVNIPGVNGYGVLKILKMNHETDDIPFIFISEKSEAGDIRKGMNLGADDYIAKPFDKADVLTAIKIRLGKIEQVRNNRKKQRNPGISSNELPNKAEFESIIQGRKTKMFGEKQIIYAEGDQPNYLYYLLKGEVKTIKTDTYGKTFVNDIYEQGEYFGSKALLLEEEYTDSAIALKPTELVLIPKEDFRVLLKSNQQVATMFVKLLAKNLSSKGERLLQLAYTPVRERVADALIRLKEAQKVTSEQIKISREDLASIVGTVRVSLNKVISEFKNEGLIDADKKNIVIKDESALRKVIQH